MSLRNALRSLGLGRLAYFLWHAPTGVAKKSIAAGGPVEQWRDARARHTMAEAAPGLPTARAPTTPGLPEIHFLTGKNFWYQTAFCLHSLQAQAGIVCNAVFHDDGSLENDDAARLMALFPAARLYRRAENDDRVAALLPPDKFPTLHRERRQRYPNMLKLTDVHAGRTGWRLVLDSDMLFFRRPDLLIDWLRAPDRALSMVDVVESYHYSRPLMEKLAGARIPERVNVGILGLPSHEFDWEKLEYWCRHMIERERTHYYLEQAVSAMIVAGRPHFSAPSADYVTFPGRQEVLAPTAIMHHYVANSKRWYFRQGWRHVLPSHPGLPASHAS